MVVYSFKSKKSADKMIEKARKIEEYAAELVECIEEMQEHSEEYDDEYSERNYKGAMRGGRYGYRRY